MNLKLNLGTKLKNQSKLIKNTGYSKTPRIYNTKKFNCYEWISPKSINSNKNELFFKSGF